MILLLLQVSTQSESHREETKRNKIPVNVYDGNVVKIETDNKAYERNFTVNDQNAVEYEMYGHKN